MSRIRPLRLLAGAALLGAAALSLGPADARTRREPVVAAGGASVDVSRLRALGLGPTADLIQAAVANSLQAGPSPSRGRLVVVLTGFSLNSYAGSDSDGGGGGSDGGGSGGSGGNFDYLEGEALVVGPGGQVIDRHPQVVSSPASSGGAYYLPDNEQRRIVALSKSFAEWLRRASL